MQAQTYLVGNLTREPELNYSQSGVAYAKFSVATNKNKKLKSGEFESIPHYFDGTIFGDLAENVAESLTKGDKVVVIGELNYDSWEDADGNKRNKVSILANHIGAELSRATAVVTRMESEAPAQGSGRKSNGPARKPQGQAQSASRRPARQAQFDDDEAPF